MKASTKRVLTRSGLGLLDIWTFIRSAPATMLEFQFGHCSIQTLSNASPGEYILHQSQYTTIYFTTALGDKWCDICFIFKPFRRACNLVYHEYEIHCLIPHGTPEETICKRLIIAVAQKVYDDYFLKNAGYKVALLETE